MRIIFFSLLLLFCIGCSENLFTTDQDTHELIVEVGLPQDQNNYYHFEMQTYSTTQALHKFTVYTNNPNGIQLIQWDCDTQFAYVWQNQVIETDIINHSSYTNEEGIAYTMFGPQVSMSGDTVKIFVGYIDELTGMHYQTQFDVILEI